MPLNVALWKNLPWSRSAFVVCWSLIAVLVAAYTIANGVVRPTMFSDSGWGLLGWDNRAGLPFNMSSGPDPGDISRDVSGFMTAWSPGQHLLPGWLEEAGLDLGWAMVLVAAAATIAGLLGWYVLYRAFGFPVRSSAIAVLIVACTRHVGLAFGIYNGGEVLLFGTAPWFLLVVWRLRDLRWSAVVPLLAAALVLFLAKLSGIVLAAAAIGAVVPRPERGWLGVALARRAVVAGVTITAMGLVFYFAWFSRGWTAVSEQSALQWPLLVSHGALAVGAVWSSSLSLGELAAYLLVHPSRPVLGSVLPVYYLFLPLALATFVLMWWRLRRDFADYLLFAALFAAAVSAVLVWTWARGSVVSSDERHFRIASLVLFGGMVHCFLELPWRLPRLAFAAIAILACAYGAAAQASRLADNARRPLGDRGFRHWIASAEALDFIRSVDRRGADRRATLIHVTSPEIGLEVRHSRVMANHADFQSPDFLRTVKLHGRVPRLYVIVQKRLVDNGKADLMLRSFVDYGAQSWRKIPLGDFVAFAAED